MNNTNNASTDLPGEIICVACPKGCRLKAVRKDGQILVTNEGCKRGIEYAISEIEDPRRMVASTVRVSGGRHPLVPVYTEEPFPKGLIPKLLTKLREVNLQAPVQIGQVVIQDALDTDINVIASRDLN